MSFQRTDRCLCLLFFLTFSITALAVPAANAADGDLLLLDSDASAGNGLLFKINRATGAATPVNNGFGCEPYSLVLQSPTSLFAADESCETVFRTNPSGGTWIQLAPEGGLLHHPSGAMVGNGGTQVLIAVGGGNIVSFDTTNGTPSPYTSYSQYGTFNPWGMTRLRDGSLAVTDLVVGKIIRIAPDLSKSIISQDGLFQSLKGITQLPDGDLAVVNVTAFAVEEILRVNLTSGAQSYLTPPGSFHDLSNLSLDVDGNLLVPEGSAGISGAARLYKVRVSDGLISVISADPRLASPVAALVVPEPATLLIFMSLFVVLASRVRPKRRQLAYAQPV